MYLTQTQMTSKMFKNKFLPKIAGYFKSLILQN